MPQETSTFSGYRWNHFDSLSDANLRSRAKGFLNSVNWDALMSTASQQRGGIECQLVPDFGLGHNHMVRIVQYSDNVRLVARLRMPPVTRCNLDSNAWENAMKSEVSTVLAVTRNTDVPVPQIHMFEVRADCDVGAPFILMDCLEGNVASDLSMEIPLRHKAAFLRALAKIHVSLSEVRLPKIGKIIAVHDDEFFKAWSRNSVFGSGEDQVRKLSGNYAEAILTSIASFQTSIGELADMIAICNHGPFPLIHGDFGHSNILVDDQYRVKGAIDFESAFAGPWEIASGFPLNLMTMPRVIDAPWNYDENGNALHSHLAQKLADQKMYVQAVELEESRKSESDSQSLSGAMHDTGRQQLGMAMGMFQNGKPGWYANLIETYSPSWWAI